MWHVGLPPLGVYSPHVYNRVSNNTRASQVVLVAKNPPAKAGDARGEGSIPGSGRSPGVGNGNPLQYSCWENPMDRGAWRVTSMEFQRVRRD